MTTARFPAVDPFTLLLNPVALVIVVVLIRAIYRLSPVHPLSHIPGPLLPRLSSLVLTYHAWIGDECTHVHSLHARYGPIVRTGPNSVDIADGAALNDIYVRNGGFRKPDFYGNFDIDGHKSIFSEIDGPRRGVRAKAVVGMFATGKLREGRDVLEEIVGRFVGRVEEMKEWSVRKGKAINLLDATRGMAVDVVCGYLFGRPFGGLEGNLPAEDNGDVGAMSASGMVDLFVGVGRFWYLPRWAFKWLDWVDAKYGAGSSKEVGKSLGLVDEFVADVVEDARQALEHEKGGQKAPVNGVATNSYPARLLSAGISISETRAQCKDLIFAGTDSTGMNLATIMFYLAKNPDILAEVERELQEQKGVTDLMEIQSLPWLRGIVKEGLRLSMANPSRLPRVVPPSGWTFNGIKFPAGTEISCTPFELHLNPAVFGDPDTFDPQRWAGKGAKSEEMERDSIPFGLGPRQCIARNLATAELFLAVKALVESGVMRKAQLMKDKIQILEWFNSHVVGGAIEMKWT